MSQVRTVTGDIDPAGLGVTLAHEHLIIDSPQVAEEWPHIHLPSVPEAVEEIEACRAAGIRAFVDAMPLGAGGDPVRLREISEATKVRVIATTGMHTAKYYRGVDWAFEETAEEMADRFVGAIEVGLGGARAGVLKVATTGATPTALERRVFEAAAEVHARTGVPLLTHCEEGRGAEAQIELLGSLGLAMGRVALSHTDKVDDPFYHRGLLETGVVLCYDQSLRAPDVTAHLIVEMVTAGFGSQLMIGTDGARRTLWKSLGGAPGLAWANTGFRDLLLELGLGAGEVEALFVDNPARWLAFSR